MIEYKEDTWIWQEYEIQNDLHQHKWLCVEKDEYGRVEYSIYTPYYGNIDEEFPMNYKFYVGDLCFENYNKIHINGRKITHIFRKEKDNIIPMNELLSYEVPVSSYVWGKEPRQDMQLYFIVNRLEEQDRELLFYVDIDEAFKRNKIEWKDDNPFAYIKWQLYSDRGFIDIKKIYRNVSYRTVL